MLTSESESVGFSGSELHNCHPRILKRFSSCHLLLITLHLASAMKYAA